MLQNSKDYVSSGVSLSRKERNGDISNIGKVILNNSQNPPVNMVGGRALWKTVRVVVHNSNFSKLWVASFRFKAPKVLSFSIIFLMGYFQVNNMPEK